MISPVLGTRRTAEPAAARSPGIMAPAPATGQAPEPCYAVESDGPLRGSRASASRARSAGRTSQACRFRALATCGLAGVRLEGVHFRRLTQRGHLLLPRPGRL